MTGAYHVAAELSHLGLIATVTSRNAQGTDILVASADGLRSISIQVKTSSWKYAMKKWRTNKKAEKNISNRFFYVFVDLKEDGSRPDFYVVPSKDVASYIQKSNYSWMHTRSRKGTKHKATTMRVFQIRDEARERRYKDQWDLLKLV